MKIDFNKNLTALNGEQLTVNDQVLTLKNVSVESLLATLTGEEREGAEVKLKRGMLAERVYLADGPMDLSPEELAMIRNRVGAMYSVLVVHRAFPLLDVREDAKEST